MKKTILIAISIFTTISLFAQTDSLYVGQTYWQRQGRADVPEWFFQVGADTLVAFSDPCLKPEVACEQAVQRALFLYALSKGVEVDIVSDYFTVYRETLIFQSHKDKYIGMANFQISAPAVSYEVLDTVFTKYGEAIARVHVFADSLQEGVDMNAFAQMMLVNNKDRRESLQTYVNLEIETPQLTVVQSARTSHSLSSSSFDGQSEINGVTLKMPKDGYWYNEEGECNPELCGRVLRYSLWHSFLDNLVFTVMNYPYPDMISKQMDDSYQNISSEKGKIYNIIRSIAREKVAFTYRYNSIKDEKLYVQWTGKVVK